jgi:hypothetical protein
VIIVNLKIFEAFNLFYSKTMTLKKLFPNFMMIFFTKKLIGKQIVEMLSVNVLRNCNIS